MRTNSIRSAIGGSIAMALCFGMSIAYGQNAPATSGYGLNAQTGDAAFNVGWSHLTEDGSGGSRTGTVLGGSAGYNATEHIAVAGEFQYARQGSVDDVSASGKLYGIVVRYSFVTGRVAPYLLAGGGGMRQSGGAYGPSMNADGWYAAVGGGVSLFLTRSWGVRPEFRYNRESLQVVTVSTGGNLYQATVGVFFQFGKGTAKGSRISSSLRSLTDSELKRHGL